ncbi:uncharacterized protein LOC111408257 [Olea europaea var. sylvestris]|uniref:uncharacterized protein LOC111408257 n=1 Tax=Olea europaea var. sylvestris TaxID=158386 RepID=UPI000C1D3EE7|nr:uncharacterized protein LOC111408257 [Olea europaea var. sylvestris]
MTSILTSQGMVLATAMAVSGSFILLALRLQKSQSTSEFSESLRSCLSSERKKKEKKKKKKKRVHFAEDVVDPIGNSDEYRRLHSNNCAKVNLDSNSKANGKLKEMPANRVALYNGILKERVLQRVAYSY